MLVSEAFAAYAKDIIAFKNQSRKTEENHFICMKALVRFTGDVEMQTLDFETVRRWKIDLEKTRSDLTVRNYIVRLRVVLQYLHVRRIPCLPVSQVPVPQVADKIPDFITEQEVAKLILSTSKPIKGYKIQNRLKNSAIIAVLYASGIRVSELCAMNISDIKPDGSFTVMGKGKKARLCFLDDRAITLINIYLQERDDNNIALFVSCSNGKRITPGNVQEVFRLARKKAGFTVPIHPHTMRHSFATNLLRNNANIRYVQAMLGHRSLETTMSYTHVTDIDLQGVYKKHHTI